MINSIIVPLFNRYDLTLNFVNQITNYLTETDELILIDNNSSDNTLSGLGLLKKQFNDKNIKIISNYKNLGFGTANNIGVRNSTGENLIFISNDVEISGDFIKIYTDNIKHHYFCGPRLITFDTGWNNIFRDKQTKEKIKTIPYLEGWSIGCKRKIFTEIGLWDENIFIDYEDVELAYRILTNEIYPELDLVQLDLPLKHNHPGSSFISNSRLEMTLKSQKYLMDKYGWEKND